MKRKNKSIKIVKLPLYSAYNRRTTYNINSARVDEELHAIADVSDILEEIIRNIFEDLEQSCGIIEEYSRLANRFENIF